MELSEAQFTFRDELTYFERMLRKKAAVFCSIKAFEMFRANLMRKERSSSLSRRSVLFNIKHLLRKFIKNSILLIQRSFLKKSTILFILEYTFKRSFNKLKKCCLAQSLKKQQKQLSKYSYFKFRGKCLKAKSFKLIKSNYTKALKFHRIELKVKQLYKISMLKLLLKFKYAKSCFPYVIYSFSASVALMSFKNLCKLNSSKKKIEFKLKKYAYKTRFLFLMRQLSITKDIRIKRTVEDNLYKSKPINKYKSLSQGIILKKLQSLNSAKKDSIGRIRRLCLKQFFRKVKMMLSNKMEFYNRLENGFTLVSHCILKYAFNLYSNRIKSFIMNHNRLLTKLYFNRLRRKAKKIADGNQILRDKVTSSTLVVRRTQLKTYLEKLRLFKLKDVKRQTQFKIACLFYDYKLKSSLYSLMKKFSSTQTYKHRRLLEAAVYRAKKLVYQMFTILRLNRAENLRFSVKKKEVFEERKRLLLQVYTKELYMEAIKQSQEHERILSNILMKKASKSVSMAFKFYKKLKANKNIAKSSIYIREQPNQCPVITEAKIESVQLVPCSSGIHDNQEECLKKVLNLRNKVRIKPKKLEDLGFN